MPARPRAYLANALFCLGDRTVNDLLATALRAAIRDLDLFVPQESPEINDKRKYADSVMIARHDSDRLMASDFLVAVIDGTEMDPGVACEIGKFTTSGRPVFALFSDVRQTNRSHPAKLQALVDDVCENQFPYRNLYVIGEIKLSGGGIFPTIDSLVDAVSAHVAATALPARHRDPLLAAIGVAQQSVGAGGGPFGAVVTRNGLVVATGTNRVTRNNDPTAHAEVVAIRSACAALGTFSLAGCVLHSSCEPCPLCLSAAMWARIDEVEYAADRHAATAAGFDDTAFHDALAGPRDRLPVRIHRRWVTEAERPFKAWQENAARVPY